MPAPFVPRLSDRYPHSLGVRKDDWVDPYGLLGVTRSATSLDIRRAYRRLANRYHEDRITLNRTELLREFGVDSSDPRAHAIVEECARERFTAVTEAYELLSDAEQSDAWNRLHPLGIGPARRPPDPLDPPSPTQSDNDAAAGALREKRRVGERTSIDGDIYRIEPVDVFVGGMPGFPTELVAFTGGPVSSWVRQPALTINHRVLEYVRTDSDRRATAEEHARYAAAHERVAEAFRDLDEVTIRWQEVQSSIAQWLLPGDSFTLDDVRLAWEDVSPSRKHPALRLLVAGIDDDTWGEMYALGPLPEDARFPPASRADHLFCLSRIVQLRLLAAEQHRLRTEVAATAQRLRAAWQLVPTETIVVAGQPYRVAQVGRGDRWPPGEEVIALTIPTFGSLEPVPDPSQRRGLASSQYVAFLEAAPAFGAAVEAAREHRRLVSQLSAPLANLLGIGGYVRLPDDRASYTCETVPWISPQKDGTHVIAMVTVVSRSVAGIRAVLTDVVGWPVDTRYYRFADEIDRREARSEITSGLVHRTIASQRIAAPQSDFQ